MTSDSAYVAVVCPVCHTRMHARIEHVGRTIACPDCGTKTTVVAPPPAAPPPKRRTPGEYKVGSTAPAAQDASPPPHQQLILVLCSLCGTRMHVRGQHAGRKVRCPDCGRINQVPEYRESDHRHQAPDLVVGEYDVGRAAPSASLAPAVFAQPNAIEHREPVPTPPRWMLLSGIYPFPWRGEVATRWAYLTLGLLVTGLVGWFALGTLIVEGPSRESVIGAGALSIVVFFLALWTFSFAAACVLPIIEETAEGADVISEWPDADWRLWVHKFLYLLMTLGWSAMLGWGAKGLVAIAGGDATVATIVGGAVTFLCVPFWLLSALESGSIVAPLSTPILVSVFKLPWAWLLVYLQSGGWVVTIAGLGWLGRRIPYIAVGALSPLLAACILIYARLVGRLGWLIVDRLGDSNAANGDGEVVNHES